MKNLVIILATVLVVVKVVCFCFDCVEDTQTKMIQHHEAIEQASK